MEILSWFLLGLAAALQAGAWLKARRRGRPRLGSPLDHAGWAAWFGAVAAMFLQGGDVHRAEAQAAGLLASCAAFEAVVSIALAARGRRRSRGGDAWSLP